MHVQSHNFLVNNLKKGIEFTAMDLAPEEIRISKSQYHPVTQDQQLYKFMLYCYENVYSDAIFASI